MATRTKKMTQAELRKFRSEVAALKRAGLTNVDARSQKPTRHMLGQLRKYRGVLDGTEKAVKVPTRKKAREYSGKFETKFDRVVVPAPQLGGRARYSQKDGDIVATADVPGGRVKSRFRPYSMEELRGLEKRNTFFSVSINRGRWNEVWRKQTLQELAAVFESGSFQNFADWTKYVNVETYSPEAAEEIDTDLPTSELATPTQKKRKIKRRKKARR